MGNEVELLERWRELALEKQRKVLNPPKRSPLWLCGLPRRANGYLNIRFNKLCDLLGMKTNVSQTWLNMALTLRMPRPSSQDRHLPTKTIALPTVSSVLSRSVYWSKP
ncbi:MAG: hypothetical protein SAK29_42370 [Scytonema sp. PMC 1069.18]|nr:hypothetical protein [Scytonema sp. PMC 1069.18]MEC4819870.1 hypothetical protein [Scytonema sp. PMC 1069.18]